jgi:DNA-binding GntR family transcriptional regulator
MSKYNTIPQQIADSIINLMKERKINNGDRLYEQQFTKLFNVSQTVIREALFILETKDLVERRPRRGVYLSLPTPHDIEKLFETRELIEVFTNRVATQILTDGQLLEIEAVMEKAERSLLKKDFTKYYQYGRLFHSKIYLFTGYSKLKKLYDNIQDLFDIYYVNKSDEESEYKENLLEINDHRKIISSMKSRNEEECQKMTYLHIKHVKQRLESNSVLNN